MSVGVSRGVLARSIAEVPLDHSVLERVEGDDGQPAARGEKLERGIKYALELSKLIVDGHAECLECPGGRMCAALAVSRRFGDAVSESERAGPRAAFKDCPCDSSGSWLFAEASKDGDEFCLGDVVEEVCGALAAVGIHAHVDRSIRSKAEASTGMVELRRADSEVEKDPVEGTEVTGEGPHVREGSADRSEAVAEVCETLGGCSQRMRVSINPHESTAWAAGLKDRVTVPAAAQGAVQVASVRPGLEGCDGGVEEH